MLGENKKKKVCPGYDKTKSVKINDQFNFFFFQSGIGFHFLFFLASNGCWVFYIKVAFWKFERKEEQNGCFKIILHILNLP